MGGQKNGQKSTVLNRALDKILNVRCVPIQAWLEGIKQITQMAAANQSGRSNPTLPVRSGASY